MLDTNIAIHVRDAEPKMLSWLDAVEGPICLSIITWIELESGLAKDPSSREARRASLDDILLAYPVLDFRKDDVAAYRMIVEVLGFSRPKLLDRLIAAQALAAGAALATLNPRDFRQVPDLVVHDWTA
jgi:tRNA(fMet)-specific endonuclease VapC